MFIAISQDNIDLGVKGYADSLENNYPNYLKKFGIKLIQIPNGFDINEYFNNFPIKGIILTGGTNIGKRPIRDQTEEKLLDLAIKRKLPMLGICRGIQFINHYFGGNLIQNIKEEIKDNVGHIATTHKIKLSEDTQKFFGKDIFIVNSFHNQGINEKNLSKELKIFAISKEDGIIEGIFHPKYPIAGIEWHPERESPDKEFNKKIINAFLKRELFWR